MDIFPRVCSQDAAQTTRVSRPRIVGTLNTEKEQRRLAEPDQTIEILMPRLDPAVMDIFTRTCSQDAAQATRVRRPRGVGTLHIGREQRRPAEPDQTIEILMSGLDPAVMDIFTRACSQDVAQATRVSRPRGVG